MSITSASESCSTFNKLVQVNRKYYFQVLFKGKNISNHVKYSFIGELEITSITLKFVENFYIKGQGNSRGVRDLSTNAEI